MDAPDVASLILLQLLNLDLASDHNRNRMGYSLMEYYNMIQYFIILSDLHEDPEEDEDGGVGDPHVHQLALASPAPALILPNQSSVLFISSNHSSPGHNTHYLGQSEASIVSVFNNQR